MNNAEVVDFDVIRGLDGAPPTSLDDAHHLCAG